MQVIRTIALQAADVTSQQIREQVAWFYLRHMDMDENVNPTTAFHALLTRKERESLPEPQGEKEKEVRNQLCTRSALFQAQLYDTISAYTKQFVIRSKSIPEELRSGLNAYLAAFNEKTIQEFIDKLTACVRQNKTADQVASELLAAWNKAAKRLADQIDRAYTQISWYSLLRYWEKEGFSKFQYVVEQKEGLCGSCLSLGSKTLTLKELLQQKLLPPLHPHCRCAILPAFGHGVSLPRIQPKPDSASQETAEDDADWYDALLRIPSDAKALLDSFVAAQQERLGRGTLGGFLDWLTMGMVSGSYQGLKARADAVRNEPTGYHILNWLTVGTADTVKGALAPDEPLSLEHWLNSLALVSIAAGAYSMAHNSSKQIFKVSQEHISIVDEPIQRPTWRQSELDALIDYPDHLPQQSFLNGELVPYGTKGSVRPDFYRPGSSVDYKNYDINTLGRRNNLVRNIKKQYFHREIELPPNTQQTFVIDIRGQNITDDILDQLYDKIVEQTSSEITIYFKVQ